MFLQTFRNYREMFDKQKLVLEKRYRELLDDSIQDAVYLSSRNNELMEENAALRKGNVHTTIIAVLMNYAVHDKNS